MADPEEYAKLIDRKTRELSHRVNVLILTKPVGHEMDFVLDMIHESRKAVNFWTEQLEKSVRSQGDTE